MTTVLHELLPDGYLILLSPGHSEAALAHQLGCAGRSGKAEVWVDCSRLPGLSAEAARLLWAAHFRLQEQYARLVLVQVAAPVRTMLEAQELGPLPRIVAGLPAAARRPGG